MKFITVQTYTNFNNRAMSNTETTLDTTNQSSISLQNHSFIMRNRNVDLSPHQGDKVDEKIIIIIILNFYTNTTVASQTMKPPIPFSTLRIYPSQK